MVYLQLFSPYRQIHKWVEKVFVFSPHKWHPSGHAWILNTQYLILGAPQNDKLCFGVVIIMLMMMMTPSENRRPKNEFPDDAPHTVSMLVRLRLAGGEMRLQHGYRVWSSVHQCSPVCYWVCADRPIVSAELWEGCHRAGHTHTVAVLSPPPTSQLSLNYLSNKRFSDQK